MSLIGGFFSSESEANDKRIAADNAARVAAEKANLIEQGGLQIQKGGKYVSPNAVDLANARITSGNISATQGATVNVGLDSAGLGSLVDKLTAASAAQIAAVGDAYRAGTGLAPPTGPGAPGADAGEAPAEDSSTNWKLGLGILALAALGLWAFKR